MQASKDFVVGGFPGVIGSVAGQVITLTNPRDARYFQVNQTIQTVSAKTGGTPSAVLRVVSSSQKDGKVTVTGTITGTAGHYVINAGDYGKSFLGLLDYITLNNPTTGESFCNVDRSSNPSVLSGG